MIYTYSTEMGYIMLFKQSALNKIKIKIAKIFYIPHNVILIIWKYNIDWVGFKLTLVSNPVWKPVQAKPIKVTGYLLYLHFNSLAWNLNKATKNSKRLSVPWGKPLLSTVPATLDALWLISTFSPSSCFTAPAANSLTALTLDMS